MHSIKGRFFIGFDPDAVVVLGSSDENLVGQVLKEIILISYIRIIIS